MIWRLRIEPRAIVDTVVYDRHDRYAEPYGRVIATEPYREGEYWIYCAAAHVADRSTAKLVVDADTGIYRVSVWVSGCDSPEERERRLRRRRWRGHRRSVTPARP